MSSESVLTSYADGVGRGNERRARAAVRFLAFDGQTSPTPQDEARFFAGVTMDRGPGSWSDRLHPQCKHVQSMFRSSDSLMDQAPEVER